MADNIIQTTGAFGILFDQASTWHDLDADGMAIERNQVTDFKTSGVQGPPASTQRVVVRGNQFDGDPRFVSANRGSNGTWLTNIGAGDLPTGVAIPFANGFVVSGNSFRNLADAVLQGAVSNVLQGNIIYANPVAIGFSTSNAGLGVIPAASASWAHVIENSDPTSASYGKIIGPTLFSASAQPTSGTYVTGQFVQNTAPAVLGFQSALTGWLRLTVGSSHAANTDWAPVYADTNQVGNAKIVRSTSGIANGGTVAFPAFATTLYLSPSGGTIAAATVTAPATSGVFDGKEIFIFTQNGDITAFTFSPASGQTVYGPPSTVTAAAPVGFVFVAADSSWHRI